MATSMTPRLGGQEAGLCPYVRERAENGAANDCAQLAAALTRQAQRIAAVWASELEGLRHREALDFDADELRALCDSALAALIECIASGSLARVDGHLDRWTTMRLRGGFDIHELVDEWMLLHEAMLPHVEARSTQRLARCMRCVTARLCVLFAARKHDQVRRVAGLEERHRLARELHDSLTQSLFSLGLVGEAAARNLEQGRLGFVSSQLREITDSVHRIMGEMRIRVYGLHPPTLESDGLPGALASRLAAVEERAGLRTHLEVSGADRPPLRVEGELLWIAHELLNNTLKHARAREVRVTLSQASDNVLLEVADDGVGFALPARRASGGLGLAGIEERAAKIRAELSIHSSPGEGTRTRVWVRLADRPAHDGASGPEP